MKYRKRKGILGVFLIFALAGTVFAAECQHEYRICEVPATCSEPGYRYEECIRCGRQINYENTPELGHVFGEWTVELEAICTRKGLKARTCNRCGYREEQEIPKTGHHYETEVVAPSCTAQGYTQHYCPDCGDRYRTDYVDALGHDYGSEVVEPTCTARGYTQYTCAVCGDQYSDSYVDAAGHRYDDGVVTKEPTLTAMGRITYTCIGCGDTYQETIPKLTNPFDDVKQSAYYFDAVIWAVNSGITTGVDETHFAPEQECTRAQVATFLWRSAGEPEPKSTGNPFVDVGENAYYYSAVLWAWQQGITTGTDGTHFSPDTGCTRGQVVTFLYRAAGEPECTTGNPFPDVKETDYYFVPVRWAAAEEITVGMDGGNFCPGETCTRGQIVTFLYRAQA